MVALFEVKTPVQTTDVYTGVGQLVIHGKCIKDLLGLAVQRYLVLPGESKASHSQVIVGKANIKVVTYQKGVRVTSSPAWIDMDAVGLMILARSIGMM